MALIKASQIGGKELERILRERGIKAAKVGVHEKVTAWKDIPPSWGVCKTHNIAWSPRKAGCPMCVD